MTSSRNAAALRYAMALPVMSTKEFAISWVDFLNAWNKVRLPYGSTLQTILANIDSTAPLPPRFLAFGYQEAGQHLIRICEALQVHHGTEPFFLSSRTLSRGKHQCIAKRTIS